MERDGYGYKGKVDMLRPLFTKNGELQVGELINIANETENGVNIIVRKLSKLGMSDIEITKFLENLV